MLSAELAKLLSETNQRTDRKAWLYAAGYGGGACLFFLSSFEAPAFPQEPPEWLVPAFGIAGAALTAGAWLFARRLSSDKYLTKLLRRRFTPARAAMKSMTGSDITVRMELQERFEAMNPRELRVYGAFLACRSLCTVARSLAIGVAGVGLAASVALWDFRLGIGTLPVAFALFQRVPSAERGLVSRLDQLSQIAGTPTAKPLQSH